MAAGEESRTRKRDRLKAGARRLTTVPLSVRTSDLPVRLASGLVMLAVAGLALWMGELVWTAFVAVVGLGVLWEWSRLAFRFAKSLLARAVWLLAGAAYVWLATTTLVELRAHEKADLAGAGIIYVGLVLGTVIAVDVGAYFAGRTIGGPKIAPRISPSKTWAGLGGGAVAAALFITIYYSNVAGIAFVKVLPIALILGPLGAIVAQAGDFFESWMKRRAKMKDSSNLIPGHGGLFDRTDGLMALLLVIGLAPAGALTW